MKGDTFVDRNENELFLFIFTTEFNYFYILQTRHGYSAASPIVIVIVGAYELSKVRCT